MKNKRVVIITEGRKFIMNYGEVLQAVALNRVIANMGFECITASYENTSRDFKYFKKHIRNHMMRALKFENFRKKHMNKQMMRSNVKEKFEKLLFSADAVVCGSDVIWYYKCYNDVFFLDFPNIQIPKIAYAPSLRDEVVNSVRYKRRVGEWAKQIDWLSTRERAGSEIIEELSGRKVETVLDPTFLLTKEEWNKMCSKRREKEPYIFFYVIGKSSVMQRILEQVEKHYPNRKCIWVAMDNNDGYIKGEGIWSVGPAEFLSLIRYADAVITDSFHGAAFSIIYQKQFYAIKRIVDAMDKYDYDCRITNILELLGINNYYTINDEIDFQKSEIDYSAVNIKLMKEQEKSVDYLNKALKRVKDNGKK